MRAEKIIQRQLQLDLEHVHLARVRVVFAAVRTLVRSGRLSLTSLGRAIAERTSPKHGIKRMDRLLGNPRLHSERLSFYRAIARRVLPHHSRPLVIVDWTAVTPKFWAIVAAVPYEGRAIIVYAETHPISRYLKPYVNSAFLFRLKKVLPVGCMPVIVADAGFRSPFMKLVAKYGWDYLIRLRGPAKIRKEFGRGWINIPFIFGQAGSITPTDFGQVEVGQRIRHVCRLIGVSKTVQHRSYRCRVRRGVTALRERKSAHEPWLLATSLDVEPGRVVEMYRLRMQIEETFRDAKSNRFGFALTHARTKSSYRADVLLLLAALGHLFALLLGIAAEAGRLQRFFQANTLRTRRVLSLPMLGRLLLNPGRDHLFKASDLTQAWPRFLARLRESFAF
jgi:hypothetical protein